MASRALGLIRDVLTAGLFGTSVYMSAFVVAFTIPNLFRRLFGEGALSAAFIPVFVETREQEGAAAAWDVARNVVSITFVFLSAITLIGILFASRAMHGPWSEKTVLTLSLLRIMLPYMIFICLAALSMGMLNANRHFALPSATPCLLNITWILTIAWIAPKFGQTPLQQIHILAWSILIAGFLQLGTQLPLLIKFGFRPRLAVNLSNPRIIQILKLTGPAALGLAVTQFNVLIDRLLAATIAPWAPASLFFSERMIYFPLGIFATALGTVLLPTFSEHIASGNIGATRQALGRSLRGLLFIMIPAAVGLFVLATPIIRAVFEWNAFGDSSTRLTARALMCYAPGLVVFSMAKVLVPAFYALKDTKTPVKIGLWTVAVNLTLNIIFILTLPLEWKHAGLALATVLAESFYAIALAVILYRRIGGFPVASVLTSASRCLAAGAVMATGVWWTSQTINPIALSMFPAKLSQVVLVGCSIGVGILIYFSICAVGRFPEIIEVLAAVRTRKR